MKKAEDILKEQFGNGLVALAEIEDKPLSTLRQHLVDEVKDFGIDSIYFSGNFPTVYFKSIKDFSPRQLNEICSTQRKIWNQKKVPFLYVGTPSEIRIYNCYARPVKTAADNRSLELYRYSKHDAESKLHEMLHIFGRVSLDSGRFWKEKEFAKRMDPAQRVDQALIDSLKETRDHLSGRGLSLKTVHRLLLRSLFVLYLEDRKVTAPEFYNNYVEGAESYFDILDDHRATFRLFADLEASFNGNVFSLLEEEKEAVKQEHLKRVKDCFWDGGGGPRLLRWRAFDFSIIPIELISGIYEIFLKSENGERKTSKNGNYYTPHALVEFILNEQLPWADDTNCRYDLKILDPTCGSGIFLVESYRRVVDRWKFCRPEEKLDFQVLKRLLVDSIFGIEIQGQAIEVAAFSLYLVMLDYLEPKRIWNQVKFPFLIFDPECGDKNKQGNNLFRSSSLSPGPFEKIEYDLVVGNPPFKRGLLAKEAKGYLETHGFPQQLVMAFLHRIPQLAPKAKFALVTASAVLFNKDKEPDTSKKSRKRKYQYKIFRKFLFNETYVEAVYNFSIFRRTPRQQGGPLFSAADTPVCVIFYQKTPPEQKKDHILYCAPKTAGRRNVIDSLAIDNSDFKFLPRKECRKGEAETWKTAMWGNNRDYALIEKLKRDKGTKSLKDYFESSETPWHYGAGLHISGDRKCYLDEKLLSYTFIPPTVPERYYTDYKRMPLKPLGHLSQEKRNFRKINEHIFEAPYVLVKKGQKNKEFVSSFVDSNSVFTDAAYGISAKVDHRLLKALTAYLNSDIILYYLFLTSSSWGIEREQLKFEEILSVPALPFYWNTAQLDALAEKLDIIIERKKDAALKPDISDIERQIDEIIYQALGLTARERMLVEDALAYGLDLFKNREASAAYYPPTIEALENYAGLLCGDVNQMLHHGSLNAWASIYEVTPTVPLNFTALHFSNREAPGFIEKNPSGADIDKLLRKVDDYTFEEYSESVFFRKNVKYYDDDTVLIIKPNEKRFWSRTEAMSDGQAIIAEILQA